MSSVFLRARRDLMVTSADLATACRVHPSVVIKQWDRGRPVPPEALFMIRHNWPRLAQRLEDQEFVLSRLDFEKILSVETCLKRLGFETLQDAVERHNPLGAEKFRCLSGVLDRDHEDRAIYATYISTDPSLIGQMWKEKLLERFPLPDGSGGYSNRYWISLTGKARVCLTYWILRLPDLNAGRIKRVTTDTWGEVHLGPPPETVTLSESAA